MLARKSVPANTKVGLVAATIGVTRGDVKEEWDLDSGVSSFRMSHTQAGMTAYKKVPAGTTVEVDDWKISPVDEFGTVEMELNHPGTTTTRV